MIRRKTFWCFAFAPVAIGVGLSIQSCSSSTATPVGLAQGCSINSDCQSPLICAFGLCHEACTESRDCPMGELCVSAGADNVCRLTTETSCTPGSDPCAAGLTCAADDTCRTACSATVACAVTGQICTSNACYDPPSSDAGPDSSSDASAPDTSTSDSSADSTVDAPPDAPAEAAPPADAGPLGFLPSNLNLGSLAVVDGGNTSAADDGGVVEADGGIDWSNAPDVVIASVCQDPCIGIAPIPVTQSDGSTANLYVLNSLKIESSQTLTMTDSVPVIFAVHTTVVISGGLNFSASYYVPGPGATAGNVNYSQGPGAGGNGASVLYPNSAAGGGSYCGVGGAAAASSGTPAPGGDPYGSPTNVPLLAGSGGGYASNFGAGGGAVQISAGTSILVTNVGYITVGGGGGNFGGGGSGGAILLEAPSVTISGNLAANGGGGGAPDLGDNGSNTTPDALPAPGAASLGGNGSGGAQINGSGGLQSDAGAAILGSGGGGAGFIRINATNGSATITGRLSPSMGTACTTQGTIAY
jgi:hypothetical protein